MSEHAARPGSAVSAPRVAVVTVNYRTADLTLDCVRSVAPERRSMPGLHMVVVDGGSGDGSAERLAAELAGPEFCDWATVLPLTVNGGFGWANNQAMLRILQSDDPPDYVHLLNPDARIEPGAIHALARFLNATPDCGAVGSLLLAADGAPSGSAFRFPSLARELVNGAAMPVVGRLLRIPGIVLTSPGPPIEADWVTGASVMFRTAALRETGLFDDGFFLYFEEVELMWRMRKAGWSVWHQPASRVSHDEGAATGVRDSKERDEWQPARPDYLYQSQRRFFVRTRGVAGSFLAASAWALGYVVRRVSSAVGLPVAGPNIRDEWRDRMRLGAWPRTADRRSGVAAVTDPPGAAPLWMRGQP